MSRKAIVPILIPPVASGTPVALELPAGARFLGFAFRTEGASLVAPTGVNLKETKLVAHTETRIEEPVEGAALALDASRTEVRTILVIGHGEALPKRRLEYLGSATYPGGLEFFVYETDQLPELVQ